MPALWCGLRVPLRLRLTMISLSIGLPFIFILTQRCKVRPPPHHRQNLGLHFAVLIALSDSKRKRMGYISLPNSKIIMEGTIETELNPFHSC